MMWAYAAMAAQLNPPTEKHYRCLSCDVYGFEEDPVCWVCGGEVKVGQQPVTLSSHRHDPTKRDVAVGQGMLHVSRGLAKLI